MVFSPKAKHRINEISQNITSYQAGQRNTPVGLRLDMWHGAILIAQKHPFLGVGTGGFNTELKKELPDAAHIFYSHPHNSFLHILVSYGFAGLTVFLWFLYVTVRRAWSARSTVTGKMILAFIFIFSVGGLTDTQVLAHTTGVILGLVGGLPIEEQKG
jgi:O-antigen ligase